jgi:hypothetical protein
VEDVGFKVKDLDLHKKQMIETTELFSLLFSLFWKNLEAHCFQCLLTVL